MRTQRSYERKKRACEKYGNWERLSMEGLKKKNVVVKRTKRKQTKKKSESVGGSNER